MYLYLSPALPSVQSLKDVKLQIPLRVYSADQRLIGEFGEQRRTPIRYEDIPEDYINALLAAEDEGFYSHNGVSIKGLVRAASHLLMTGKKKSGGSTITMQVTREFFLHRKKHFKRKFNEILLAIEIEKELSKAEILELYVNMIFLGNRAYGIQAAAEIYYGQPLAELSIAQLAMIAGLQQAPSINNPIANPIKAKMRRDWILTRMRDLGKIDQTTFEQAQLEPVTAEYHRHKLDFNAPYIAELARQEALKLIGEGAYTNGYTIQTTIDSRLQAQAQAAIARGLHAYDNRHGYKGPELRQTDIPQEDQPLALKLRSTIHGLVPALVTQITPDTVTVQFKDGQTLDINWDELTQELRLFATENRTTAAPKEATELLMTGDIIRLKASMVEAEPKSEATTSDPTSNPSNTNGTKPTTLPRWQLAQIPEAQAALVSIEATTGKVLALVGGYSFDLSRFNRATQAKRQPGSSFKPFLYTAALENGFTPATLVNDAPIVFDDDQLESTWRPENSSGKFYGPTRLRKALYLSRNLVSIRVLRSMGVRAATRNLERFGVDPRAVPRDLSLALGSHVMTPFEVATGYSVLANGGYQVTPALIHKIASDDGTVIFEQPNTIICPNDDCTPTSTSGESEQINQDIKNQPNPKQRIAHEKSITTEPKTTEPLTTGPPVLENSLVAKRVIEKDVAYLMDSMLKDVVRRGTATKAKSLKRNDVAGKTGTTNGPLDAWFSGYAGGIATTAWVGFDDNSNLGVREFGGSAALPIWIDYMQEALKGVPEVRQSQPPSVVSVRINPETGERARINDPDAIFEVFRVKNAPKNTAQTEQSIPDNIVEYHEEIF